MDSTLCFMYFLLILALYSLTKHFFHKQQNFPPTPLLSLPFVGHLYLVKRALYRSLAKISDRYGPIVLLQFGFRRVLVVSSPSAAEECLSKNDVIFANCTRLLAGKHLGYNYTALIWSSYGCHWKDLHKTLSNRVLSTRWVDMLREIRAEEITRMICHLCRASTERQFVDMRTVFFELTMNMMTRMIARKRYYGKNAETGEETKRFKEIVTHMLQLATLDMGDFLPLLRWLQGVIGVEKGLVELQRKWDDFMQELVEESKNRPRSYGGGKTMIEMLLALQKKDPEYYTDALIRRLMLVLLMAGTDTSAGTMEWALSLLLNHPDVLKNAQSEIDENVGHDRLLREADIDKLPYLHCIIKEAIRLHPVRPILAPRESSEKCSVEGYRVPAGTMLLVNAWAIQNDPKYWEDASEFRPERFARFHGSDDAIKSKFIPFGYGTRGCPGEYLAMRMVVLGVGSLIQCFDWQRAGKELADMTEGGGLTLLRAKPLMTYCRARALAAGILSHMYSQYEA